MSKMLVLLQITLSNQMCGHCPSTLAQGIVPAPDHKQGSVPCTGKKELLFFIEEAPCYTQALSFCEIIATMYHKPDFPVKLLFM